MKEILMSSEHFGFGLSIFIYLLAIQIKLRLKWDFLNPLLVSTIIIVGILLVTEIPYAKYKQGAGLLSYFLTPATVCLAIPLYKQWSLLKNNFKAVFLGIFAGTLSSIGSILLLGILFHLPNFHLIAKIHYHSYRYGNFGRNRRICNLNRSSHCVNGYFGKYSCRSCFSYFPNSSSHCQRSCFRNQRPCHRYG